MKLLLENWREYLKEQETIALGQCYPFAVEMSNKSSKSEFADLSKFKVVHGRITDKFSGESVLHAWVEKGNMVFDDQTKHTRPNGTPKAVYYDIYQPEPHEEYTAEETILKCIKTGHKGPWTNNQRELPEYLYHGTSIKQYNRMKENRFQVKEFYLADTDGKSAEYAERQSIADGSEQSVILTLDTKMLIGDLRTDRGSNPEEWEYDMGQWVFAGNIKDAITNKESW